MNKTILYCIALAMGSALVAGEQYEEHRWYKPPRPPFKETQRIQVPERRANDEGLSPVCEAANKAKPAWVAPKTVKLIHNHDMILKFPYESVPEGGPWVHRSPVNVRELAWQYISPNWGDAGVRHEVTTLNPDGTHTTLLSVYPQCSDSFSDSTWSAQCDNDLYTAHNVLQASVEPECPCGSYSYSCTWRKLWDMRHAISKRQRKAHCNVYDLQERAATTESLIQTEQDATAKEKYSQLLQLANTGIKACIAWYQNPGRQRRERNQERDACEKASQEFFYNTKWTGGNYWKEMEERNHE